MAAGSMRETIRALNAAFVNPAAPYPLPDELCATIENFLERYHDIEDHDSQRFHEDLHALYMRHVAGSPEKHGAFLSVLRRLRPALTGEVRMTEWWELVLKPTIDGMGHKRHEIEDAREIIQSILVYDEDEDKDGDKARLSNLFTKKLLDAYLARTKLPSSIEDVLLPEDEFLSHELEAILVTFGCKKPKALLLALDELFVQKQYRIQTLNLLSAFVRLQPPHLHSVLETSLVQHLEKCLLIDTSSTAIELALMVLIMFLPHISGALTSDNHLARLFLIYSRVLCWDKFGNPEDARAENEKLEELTEDESEDEVEEPDQAWEQLHHSEDYPDTAPPTTLHYFTFLYGLFPLNFMAFVRKPRKYLKSLNFPGASDFDLDQDLIHSRTEPYRRVHLLHPNMFTTTIEDELQENRWLKSDPADVVTECMDLCVAVSPTLADPGPPPTSKLPDLPVPPPTTKLPNVPVPPDPDDHPPELSLDEEGDSASWRNTQSTMFVPPIDAPEVPETFEIPPRTKSLKSVRSASPLLKCRDVMDSPTLPAAKDTKALNPLSPPQPAPQRLPTQQPSLEIFAQAVTSTGADSPTRSDFQNQSMASLQREIMLLRNDLNFERYLKLQHLTHIGQLQRKHIKEATAEAETQNLLNTNKTLKARLAKANELYAQLKKETATSRSQTKKWESELSAKVRSYREDQKGWQSGEDSLRFELQKAQSDCEHLKKIVEKAEAEQLKAQQRTRALEYELEDYGKVRRELETAQETIMTYEDQSKELNSLIHERNELRNDLEIANMRLSSREMERERSIKAYERRILELESRLQSAERNTGKPGQLPPSIQQMLDSALAANNAKLQQLKKTHYRLLEQYTELEMKYHDLEGERQAELGPMNFQGKGGYPDFEKSSITRSMSMRQREAFGSKHLPPLSTDTKLGQEYDYYQDMSSPASPPSASAARPVRMESLPIQRTQKSQRDQAPIGFGQDFSAAYDASLNAQFQAQANSAPTVNSSGKSSYSVDTEGSEGKRKDKVDVKSEVRVYGRGGAQNIGKKVKEKEAKKSGQSKTGGFRGLKGIM